MLTTLEVGKKLVDLCNKGKNLDAIESLYAPNAVSIEAQPMPGMPARHEGSAAIKQKNEGFFKAVTVHSSSAEGPWPHGDRFIVKFKLDMTAKDGPVKGQRMQMEETGLYTVKNGKITQEEFFYVPCSK